MMPHDPEEADAAFIDGLANLEADISVMLDATRAVFMHYPPRNLSPDDASRTIAEYEHDVLHWKDNHVVPLLRELAMCERLADDLDLTERWNEMTHEHLIDAVGHFGSTNGYLREEAEHLAAELFGETVPSTDAVEVLRRALGVSLMMQVQRRKDAIATDDSVAAMEFLVAATGAAKSANANSVLAYHALQDMKAATERLVRMCTKRLTWHVDIPDAGDARAEIVSMAYEKLLERLSPIMNADDPLKARLLAAIDGQLKNVTDNVRAAVRGRLETVKRHRELSASEKDRILSESNILVDRVFSASDGLLVRPITLPTAETDLFLRDEERRVEIALRGLSEKERALVDMTMEGYTQEEIAAKLGKSRAAVAKMFQRIKPKVIRLE